MVSLVVPIFKNVGERSTAKNYRAVSLLSVVSKVFEKLVNNRIVDHIENRGRFSDFQYGFRSYRLTADLVTVVSDRIARAFNRSGATQAVALDISRAFRKLKSYEISGEIFDLISSFVSNRRLWVICMASVHKNILKAPFLVLHFFYYASMTYLMMLSVILLSRMMLPLFILNVIRHLICGNNLNWLLNLNLSYKTLWTGARSCLLISVLGKFDWFRLTGLITMVLLM